MKVCFIFCLLFFTLEANIILSQERDSLYDKENIVYWFDIKIKESFHKNTKKVRYIISLKNKKINHGSLRTYEKHLFKSLFKRKYLPVGPFGKLDDAKLAVLQYDLKHHNDSSMKKVLENMDSTLLSKKYYWFVYLRPPKIKHPPVLRRAPALIANGSLIEFKANLWELILFRSFAFGPFTTKMEAERAKRLYRLAIDE